MINRREVFIEALVKQHGLLAGAELGLWQGRVFLHLLKTCPELSMIGVDAWKARPENKDLEGGETYDTWDMESFESSVRLAASEFGPRSTILKMDTTEAAKEVENDSLDFIFIDASHDYDSVSEDLDNWVPKVRTGGFVVGHDWDWPTVRKAVREVFPASSIQQGVDNVWWTLKGYQSAA